MEGAESLFLCQNAAIRRNTRAPQLFGCGARFVVMDFGAAENAHRAEACYSTRLASSARPSVTSSANSRSPPTGRPLARRVTLMSKGLIRRAR